MRARSVRPIRARDRALCASLLLAAGLVAGPAGVVAAQETEPTPSEFAPSDTGPASDFEDAEDDPVSQLSRELDGPVYEVSRFDVRYREEEEDAPPPIPELLWLPVELGRLPTGFVAPRDGIPTERVRLELAEAGPVNRFHASALGAIATQILARFQERGILGVYIAADERDIEPESERDLRRPGDTVLRMVVSVGRVRELRSVGFGDRLPEDWRINNRVHRRIRERSPIQPERAQKDGATSLLDSRRLEEYLHWLNRHPGRQVDAALAPSEDGEGIALDFRVSESRPWYAYVQTSNTGTEETNRWQNRIGVVHQQLTDRDDILRLEYLNAGINDVNAVNFEYDAPWFGPERPSWWRSSPNDPWWISWLPRDSLPWFGAERLRWRVFGSWTRTLADDVSFTDEFESIDWDAGFHLDWNVFQHGAFFVDLYGGYRIRSINDENETAPNDVSTQYLHLPGIGLEAEHTTEYSSFFADVFVEGTANSLDDDAELLGRVDPDDRWVLLEWTASWSHFLEPLFNRKAWEDPATPGSSTLAHELRISSTGQWAFDRRLLSQVTQVIGGQFSVRGYPQSLAVGDSVAIGSLEYRFHLARSLPLQREPLQLPGVGRFRVRPQHVYGAADWDVILSAFIDAGRTWRHDRPSDSTQQNDTLVGAGLGIELLFRQNLRARFDWGRALHSAGPLEDRTDSGDNEFHFLFSVLY